MFGSLRNKFQTVQDGISAGIKGLTASDNSKPKKTANVRNVNYDAGADLLFHYQTEWNELHDLTEQNAGNAEVIDSLVASIHEKLEQEWNSVARLNNALASVPKINNDIQNLMDQIGSLQELFEEVEGAIFEMEDLKETLDLQSSQLDHRFQLALYKEKKLSELDSVRAKLANDHSNRVLLHELKQQKILKERQETFGEVFKQEMQEYKTTGSVPKLASVQHGQSLDEVELDNTDFADLDEFLKN
ncbi:dysbindin protein homolog isoform X1 [Neodiprion pinetum]|uniref:dysbindin protein homolog isoform X1 n=1 Tax=Neodiprion pinetum TaxID=441929 RepID=UPI001EDFCAB0|nr:dysbindin protein homolog isoform X1 [Neodiprion pinetum]XP_046609085.1 dysbindin protein homolog isoform X1 [Neodiprion virginianus]